MKLPVYKKILVAIGVLLALFLVMNFGYFWANFRFLLRGPGDVYQTEKTTNAISQKMPANLLVIPSLGITAPVVDAAEPNEKSFQAALLNGVGHYPGTANAGELGNDYIFGHSSDFIWSKGKYKSIFAVLPFISKGAEIIISDAQGNKFTYIVTSSRRVAANDLSVLDQNGRTKKLLSLQTSYPVGTALARWVVVAEIK